MSTTVTARTEPSREQAQRKKETLRVARIFLASTPLSTGSQYYPKKASSRSRCDQYQSALGAKQKELFTCCLGRNKQLPLLDLKK